MPFFTDPFSVSGPFYAGLGHRTALWPAPPTSTVGSIADDAEHVRSERRVDAVNTNRPDYDAVPEHDTDGTPWAA